MSIDKKNVLLIAMPFAGTTIPTVPLSIFEGYLKERNINIRTRHLYLKATEFYGLNNYNFLIYGPNETYPAQMAFSKYVFPEHWKKNKDKFRKYFNKKISKNRDIQKNFTFESYVQQTDKFCNWLIENVDWKNYDIIGFSIDYGQLLPSLAVAKKIKGLDSEKKIIFHGSRTVDQLGIKVLEAFDYVDFIVSGDAEDALFLLASDYQNYESIPHLIYRAGKEIIWNKSDDVVDLNSLPIPSFDSFYEELGSAFNEVKQYFYLYGRLPVEISRGCWWNKCTFCNLNLLHKKYTEKNIDKIIKEIKFLFNKYEMLSFSLVGNVLPKKNFRNLLEEIKKLKTDFSFMVETRTDHLKSNDYKLLKEAGFSNLLTGIESFSKNYLKKMNKGIRVIDNIAALKFCKENDIDNRYNIVINYPNEKRIDYEETMKNIQIIKQYLDPPNISRLIVGFGSPVYYNLEQFNIDKLDSVDIDRLMFPERFLKKGFNCIYGFKRKEKLVENDWVNLIEDWRKEREDLVIEAMRRKTTIDKLIFYFVDGKKFLKIYDKRNIKHVKVYVLNKLEREIFLSCIDIASYKELRNKFKDISENDLVSILKIFEENNIIFKEDDSYLSLPLRYRIEK